MWTINDFLAYGMLSYWSTHGKLAYPYCMENNKAFTLANGGKASFFDCHRRFLPLFFNMNSKWMIFILKIVMKVMTIQLMTKKKKILTNYQNEALCKTLFLM